MSRSVECSGKEKKHGRGLVVRVLRASEVKVTRKQNKNQNKPPPTRTKNSPQKGHTQHKDRKACCLRASAR